MLGKRYTRKGDEWNLKARPPINLLCPCSVVRSDAHQQFQHPLFQFQTVPSKWWVGQSPPVNRCLGVSSPENLVGDNFIATTFSVIRFVCSKSFWTWKWNLLQTEIWFWLWNFTILVFWEPIISLLYNSSFSKIIDL